MACPVVYRRHTIRIQYEANTDGRGVVYGVVAGVVADCVTAAENFRCFRPV